MEKCPNCDNRVTRDAEGKICECKYCGLEAEGHEIDIEDISARIGDNAHMEVDSSQRVNPTKKNGSVIDPRDLKGLKDKEKRAAARIRKGHSRANYDRKIFADQCMDELRKLGLGSNVEQAVKLVLRASMTEHSREGEVKPLPRNQMRFMTGREMTYRARACLIAALRTAAKFGLIEAVGWSHFSDEWGIERKDCHRITSHFINRINRMLAKGCLQLPNRNNPRLHRDLQMSTCMGQIRGILHANGVEGTLINLIMNKVLTWLMSLDEPGVEGPLANERIDMLVAILTRRALEECGVRNMHGRTAVALGLSAGGVTQRVSRLRPFLLFFLG